MLSLLLQSPKKATRALLKQKPLRADIDAFKNNLIVLLDKINVIESQPKDESEEHLKNNLRDFLRDTYYKDTNAINTKDKKDLVIHTSKTTDSPVAIIIEAKRPTNVTEMISGENANKKALHELILYYFNERTTNNNTELKHLIITNINEWYIIDANFFDKHIYRNTQLSKLYQTKINDKKDNPFFYEEAAKIIQKLDAEIPCTYFDIRYYNAFLRNANTSDDNELISLFKIFSPAHLLKETALNDSNSLNEKFYKELLHIIGLEEVKEGSKNIIRRKVENRNSASFLETTIDALLTEDSLSHISNQTIYGETKDERLFNIALELSITWVNRILFLKLLESQLISYNQGDKNYSFLNTETIPDFDELFKLFHKVLAVKVDDRADALKHKYNKVPYLNSALFEISELEDQALKINALDNSLQLELLNSTILKDDKKNQTKLPTLNYLFKFLNAYDFASESTEDIQEESKTIITASVLGKVFEKINGYKDGSIFTPAFITMYMCRQSIHLAVVQKFNDAKGWNLESFDQLYNKIEDVKEANTLINSIKICDPAVGSGHFLVSALNELIAIKSELRILSDKDGKRLKETYIDVIDDELYIIDEDEKPFKYNFKDRGSQRIQETLFNEKQILIENCLFGVDINPKSVLICRLRLWIELLKNAYYIAPHYTSLETLPNIDINIKCGNSLISRFKLNDSLKTALAKSKWNITTYRNAVYTYKNETGRDAKKQLLKLISEIKNDFKTEINKNNKEYKKLLELQYEFNVLSAPDIFKNNTVREDEVEYGSKDDLKKVKARIKTLEEEINKRTKAFKEIEENIIYKNAFEWRFEFPEVLNDEGDFLGFDLMIGNPPYGVSMKDKLRAEVVNSFGKLPDFEIYYYFINLSKILLKQNGIKSFIIPNTILFNVFAKNYREKLFDNWQVQELLDCTNFDVFEGSATVRCVVTQFINKESNNKILYRPTANALSFEELIKRKLSETSKNILLENNQNWALVFKLTSTILDLIKKIKSKPCLIDNFDVSQGYIPYRRSDLIKVYGEEKAKSIVLNREWHSDKKINKEYKGEIWGESITKYTYNKPKSFVWYGKHLAGYVDLKYFNQARILVREITNPNIIACIVSEELVNDPQIISIINKNNDFSLNYLWAILNSKLATFYHFNSSPKATKGAFPKILVEDIKKFPLPNITKAKHEKISALVDKIILQKQNGESSIENEKKIDALVYELYNLTEEEIAIIETN